MRLLYLGLIASGLTLLHGGPRHNEQTPAAKQVSQHENRIAAEKRAAVLNFSTSTLGWKEKGQNSGPEIERILDSVGLKGTRSPYCAAWIYWVGKNALGAQNPYPRSAWSPDMVRKATWVKGKGREPQPGDVGGLFFPSKGRIAHVFLIEKNLPNLFVSQEANTSPDAAPGSAADRDGGGVYRKRRLKSQVHSVRNWID